MELTNPGSLVHVEDLNYFEGKLAEKYATKSETGTDFATEAECRSIVTNYGQ